MLGYNLQSAPLRCNKSHQSQSITIFPPMILTFILFTLAKTLKDTPYFSFQLQSQICSEWCHNSMQMKLDIAFLRLPQMLIMSEEMYENSRLYDNLTQGGVG